uniref:Gamma-interferon-inducible lysosomal thiol reductase n=1 Tax=Homalodisca liturata TaxID=320908 RepID=A0A1B6I1E2_9HEMI
MLSLVFLCLYLLLPVYSELEETPLTLTLYYESYCDDCIRFLENQLSIAWQLFKDDLRLDMVPFGKAKKLNLRDGGSECACHHGPKECLGNKLHACAILQACGKSGTLRCAPDQMSHVLNYILCVEKTPNQHKATHQCAESQSLDPTAIIQCATSHLGAELHNHYGNRTRSFSLKGMIDFVPTVVLDGEEESLAVYDLVWEICKLRPRLCTADAVQTYLKKSGKKVLFDIIAP